MISEGVQTGQLLFLCPQDPIKSFFYPFDKNNAGAQSLEDLINKISEEKQHYLKVSDSFGRSLPKDKSIDQFRSLQPFYITKMTPKVIIIHIMMPEGDEVLNIDIDPIQKIELIKERIQQISGVPIERQKLLSKGCRIPCR